MAAMGRQRHPTLRAECRRPLHLQTSYCRLAKAVIQDRESLTNHAAPTIKVSYAQIMTSAKFYVFLHIVSKANSAMPDEMNDLRIKAWREKFLNIDKRDLVA